MDLPTQKPERRWGNPMSAALATTTEAKAQLVLTAHASGFPQKIRRIQWRPARARRPFQF